MSRRVLTRTNMKEACSAVGVVLYGQLHGISCLREIPVGHIGEITHYVNSLPPLTWTETTDATGWEADEWR